MAVMSRASTSLELSEFFNNDESGGHRLAEFLQKKRGGVQRRNFLFMNCEPLRLSLDVQLEKVPKKNPEKQAESAQKENETSIAPEVPVEDEVSDKALNEIGAFREECAATDAASLPCLPTAESKKIPKPLSPTSKAGKRSPRLSVIRKSGGVSPGDRLRRYSLSNRLSKSCARPRTLLQEFEGTISDSGFAPNICSTPLSQEAANKDEFTPKRNADETHVSHGSNEKEKSLAEGVHCCSHTETFLKSPQSKDQDFRNMVKSIVETTLKSAERVEKENLEKTNHFIGNSPRRDQAVAKKTFTLEKGQMPGQVILTPDVPLLTDINTDLHSKVPRLNDTQNSPRRFGNTSNRSLNQSQFLQRAKSPYATSPSFRKPLHEGDPNSNKNLTSNRSFGPVERSPRHIPDQEETSNITLRSKKHQCSTVQTLKTPERIAANRSQITIRVESPRVAHSPHCGNSENRANNRTVLQEDCRTAMAPDRNRCNGPISPPTVLSEFDITNTQHVNISVAYELKEEVVVPETQDPGENVQNDLVIRSRSKNASTVHDGTFCSPNTVGDKDMSHNVVVAPPDASVRAEAGQSPNVQQVAVEQFDADEDNLKLTDIMTDDEDPPPTAVSSLSVENNSQAPLNLAASKNNVRTKRLRKRSMSRRRLNMDNSQVMSTEAENELPPAAHNNSGPSRKRSSKRKCIPLNKAPGAPLNGEQFATELARMSNYEILDLRKRNSMGRVFAISGRKSWWAKEHAIKKQIQLDDEIEMELLRRNLDTTNDKGPQQLAAVETDQPETYAPVPDEFRDSTIPHLDEPNMESSLIDEKSCDRVSLNVNGPNILSKEQTRSHFNFQKPQKLSLKQRTLRKKKVPEILQHYLDVPNRLSKKKNISQFNASKRSLYTKGQSDSEETNISSSIESNLLDNPAIKSLPYVRSPPTSETAHMSFLRVVSPPPPMNQPVQQTADSEPIEETLPPPPSQFQSAPPSQFESDSGIDSNIANTGSNKSIRKQRVASEANVNTEIQDVFKVPLHPPPKSRARKKTPESKPNSKTSSEEQSPSFDTTDTSENSTLRRSKRGHVPLKNAAPLFQVLFQKVLNKNDQKRERMIAKEKKKKRDNLKAPLENCSSDINGKEELSNRRRGVPVAVSESDILDDALRLNVQATVPKTKAKTKITQVRRKENKKQKETALECSRIKLSNPPPLDHFNNVFDHLRNTSGETTSNNDCHQSKIYNKEKKLKVRVARLKFPQVVQDNADPFDVPTSRKDAIVSHSIVATSRKQAVDSACSSNHLAPTNSPSVSSTAAPNHSNSELISWLKNITGAENTTHSGEIFNEMRISSASNLSFTELQGVEYAFYDTEDKASLGYLRFKPRQIKPKKKAKRYHLHFVTLVGKFRITANDKESIVGPGDMIAIKKSIYYDIENLCDDIGILMVIKK